MRAGGVGEAVLGVQTRRASGAEVLLDLPNQTQDALREVPLHLAGEPRRALLLCRGGRLAADRRGRLLL